MELAVFLLIVVAIIFVIGKFKSQNTPPPPLPVVQSTISQNIASVATKPAESDTSLNYEKDAWEGTFRDGYNSYPVEATLQIEYKDGSGNKTSRVIEVMEADNIHHDGIIYAYCRMRESNRTFRFERIISCVDLDTGEIINDLSSYLTDKYKSSPSYAINNFFENNTDLIKCLLYIGKADGQLRQNERAIILETCKKLADNDCITSETVNSLLDSISIPSQQAYKLAVGRIISAGNQAQIDSLISASKNIVATQKTIAPLEQDALDFINRKIESKQFKI